MVGDVISVRLDDGFHCSCEGSRPKRDGKEEGCPRSVVGASPKLASVAFYNGAANGQAHPHSGTFRGVKSVENTFHVLRINTDSAILDRKENALILRQTGADNHLPGATGGGVHRLRGVHDQVENDLLELNPVTLDQRQCIGELWMKHDTATLQFTQQQGDDFPGRVVEVDAFDRNVFSRTTPAIC